MTIDYEVLFQSPTWFDAQEAKEHMATHRHLSRYSIYSVAGSLGALERLGKLPGTDMSAFEFGSGRGEGLLVLDMLARAKGEQAAVVGSEKDELAVRVTKQAAGALERVTRIAPDGFAALDEAPESFDFILANMFGASRYNSVMVAKFVVPALAALKPSGTMLINSDRQTMNHVQSWTQANLPSDQVEVISPWLLPPGLGMTPHVLLSA